MKAMKPEETPVVKSPLLNQEMAVQSYLQELLNEVTWSEPPAPQKDPEPEQSPEESAILTSEASSSLMSGLQTVSQLEALEAETTHEILTTEESNNAQKIEGIEPALENKRNEFNESNIPPWAGDSFRALYARHGRLKLVMPLVQVQTVLKAKELVRVNGPLDVCVGYVQHGTRRIPVLDVNALNGSSEKSKTDDITSMDSGYVAVAENHTVGLYFSKIDDTHEVHSAQISWRCNDESAHWIAGVNADNLSIIVDFTRLCDLL